MRIVLKLISFYWKRCRNFFMKLFFKLRYGKNISLNNSFLGKYFELDISAKEYNLTLGKNVRFKKYSLISMRDTATVSIGSDVFFNCNISITARNKIVIGNNCMFGENVKLYDHNHAHQNKNKLFAEQGYNTAPIVIGNNCWIGSNVTILKNVTIGDNVVIGAHCLIYKNIPSNSVVTANISTEVKIN